MVASGAPDNSNWPPGLQRNRPEADRVGEADDVVVVLDRLPAEKALHGFEQAADAALTAVGNRRMIGEVEAELLVLGPHAPRSLRLAAGKPAFR